MRILKKYSSRGYVLGFMALCTILFFTSCQKESEEIIIEDPGISLDDLYGKWSITSETETVTDAAGTQVSSDSDQWGTNLRTIEFSDDGKFLYIEVKGAEWGTGNFTLDTDDESLELDFGSELTDIAIENLDATSATFKIVELEVDNGDTLTSTSTITLVRNSGNEPGINAADLNTKWSMASNKVYVDGAVIASDVINEEWMETENTIADDMYTLELKSDNSALSINNYSTGLYTNGTFQVLDASNFVIEFADSDPILFHITANDGSGRLTVVYYSEDGDSEVKVEQGWKSSFTSTSIDVTKMTGNWIVTAKTEGKEVDGQTATPDGDGPPVGSILTFNADGTGMVGGEQFTFEFLDESNMVLTFSGEDDSALVHFETFNGTNEVSVFNMDSGWENGSFEQNWLRMDLSK